MQQNFDPLFADFDEAYEIVPGRHYEVVHRGRTIRVLITRVLAGSRHTWYAFYDEAVHDEAHQTWTVLSGVPHIGGQPTDEFEALRQAAPHLKRFLEP